MFSVLKAAVLVYLALVIITEKFLCANAQHGQHGHRSDIGIDITDDPFGVSMTEEGSGEPESVVFNATAYPEVVKDDTLPHLVIGDASGRPCLVATLNASMQVYYRVPEGIVHETYIAFAEIQLPEDVNAQGVCGENESRLLLDWGNNTFHVNFTFTRNEPISESDNTTWSLTDLAISYDMSNQAVFPGTSETETITVEKEHMSLFTTPVGSTYDCSRKTEVLVGSNERGVHVSFHNVKLATFGVMSSEFPPGLTECSEEDEYRDQEELLIPLIVACCLSAVVILIVIAYVISRKVQASRDQSQYKQMP